MENTFSQSKITLCAAIMPINDQVLRKGKPGWSRVRAGQRHFGAELRRDLVCERAEHLPGHTNRVPRLPRAVLRRSVGQFLSQRPARLNEERLIDGFVRDMHAWIRGIVGNQPQNPDSELRAGSAQRGRYRQKPGLFSPGAWA